MRREPRAPGDAMVRATMPSGFVLPAVLGALLIITVISFAMSLIATLELLSARSASDAVAVRAMADSALALSLAEVRTDLATATAAETTTTISTDTQGEDVLYGPWPQHEIAGSATLRLLAAPANGLGSVYRLTATAEFGRALATAGLVFTLEPQLVVLERTR